MKRTLIRLIAPGILAGIILTALLTAQMTWRPRGDCSDRQAPLTDIRRVDCSGMVYGFPGRFIETTPHLDTSVTEEGQAQNIMLGVTSTLRWNYTALLADLAFWSLLSMALIYIVQHRKDWPRKSSQPSS